MTFKPDDSPYWYTDFFDEHGKRVRVSTKKKNKREADDIEARMMVKAQQVRLGLDVRDPNADGHTVESAARWWLKEWASKQAQGVSVGSTVEKHIIKSELGPLRIERVTPAHVTRWLAGRALVVPSPSTVNHLRAHLMSIFTRMIDFGYLVGAANPVRGTKKLETEEPESRALPPTWVVPLINHAPTMGWRLAIAVAAYTGMRSGEIKRALSAPGWPSIDLDERVINIRKAKGKRVRRVAVHTDLVEMLRASRDLHVKVPGPGAYGKAHQIVRHALARAGIVDAHDLRVDDATFHGLRGTWDSRMDECGAKDSVVDYMGWGKGTTSRRRHYSKFSNEQLRREIDKLTWP